jgi:hypothetical protein
VIGLAYPVKALVTASPDLATMAACMAAGLGMASVSGSYVFWERRRQRRRERDRQVIPGWVVHCTVVPVGKKGFLRPLLEYAFDSPDGVVVDSAIGTASTEAFPPSGTPVAVLYLDRRNYHVL